MEVRQRRVAGSSAKGGNTALGMPGEDEEDRKYRVKKRARKEMNRGLLWYLAFIFLFLGIPLAIVVYATPFFVLEQLKCRAQERFWFSDAVVTAMEGNYASYFSNPPLYLSEEYNQTMFWGTYEPSRIFAMKSRSPRPVTVGIAWYDVAQLHPIRHHMPYMHNKVNAPRVLHKKGRDPEVMNVRWITHDGIHYGKEMIEDHANKMWCEVEFLKNPSGTSWHVRVHARMEGPPLDMVLYVVNDNPDEAVELNLPDGHNDGDWSPVLKSQLDRHDGRKEAFVLRVYDDHNPLFDTAPWRIYGLHGSADESFSLVSPTTVGGTLAERAAAGGRGIASGVKAEQMQEQRLNLRELPPAAFRYIDTRDQLTFRTPEAGSAPHNMIVMKKSYSSSFRLELSLSPASFTNSAEERRRDGTLGHLIPRYDALTTCQLTNTFRRREKAIYAHAQKIFKPWVQHFNVSGKLYQHIAAQTLGEAFGSVFVGAGHYLQADTDLDAAWDRAGEAAALFSHEQLYPSPQEASVVASVGSRTDEAFGQQFHTGLQQIFLVRWNKELVKDIVASWVLGAQNPATGFIPNRATLTAATRSLAPAHLRYEHVTFGSPPTILLGLQELLNEMERKEARLQRASQRKVRNTAAYYQDEVASDVEYLTLLLPALKKWRSWWHQTQCGATSLEAAAQCASTHRPLEEWPREPTGQAEDLLVYRWRSRDGARLPASGMEDYPRPVCRGEHQLEAHVDLFAWVALLSRLISRIEVRHLRIPESVTVDWEAYLNALHWDSEQGRYADRIGCQSQPFSTYTGYANLYPVILGTVTADRDKVRRTLDIARKELWTPYGLMSVSYDSVRKARESQLPHQNLWMGPVWPSTNLMFLYALKTIYVDLLGGPLDATQGGREADDLYEQLHLQLVETLRSGRRWWEYYNPVEGDGEGSKTYIGTQALLLGVLDDFS